VWLALVSACAPIGIDLGGVPRFSLVPGGTSLSLIDFGVVAMEQRVERKVLVTNVGRGPLLLDGFTKEGDGPSVQLGTTLVEAGAVFGVDQPPSELSPGQSRMLTFFFQPPLGLPRALVDHAVTLGLQARNVAANTPALQLELSGRAIRPECDVPTRLDFGPVARGDSIALTETFKNPLPIGRSLRIGALQSAQNPSVFSLTADSPRGEVVLAPAQEAELTFVFSPSEVRDYSATIRIQNDDQCPEMTMRLVGTGIDSAVLSATPSTVDFGYVQPITTVTTELSFFNRGFKPVQLSDLATREANAPSLVYQVVAANPGDATRLTVPGAARDPVTNDVIPGVAKVTLSFRPTVLGPRNATLVFVSDLRAQPNGAIPLRGFGGGPDIDVLPTLDFGPIDFTPGGLQSSTRLLVVRNVGTAPHPADPSGNLRLGVAGEGRPLFTVTPKNSESEADEICVGVFDALAGTCTNDLPSAGSGAYDPAIGLVAAGAASTLEIPVRIQPRNTRVNPITGTKAWEITLFSNDPDEPEVRLTVTAGPIN
jgi:hypothetical protein